MDSYREGVWRCLERLLEGNGRFSRALDFGCGDGWFAERMLSSGRAGMVVPVEVQLRRRSRVRPALYDGESLPFADRSFELVYAIDVLHHAPSPPACIAELLRCASDMVIIKDHTAKSPMERLLLAVLDEMGNRRFGVRSVYRYQRHWEWNSVFESAGFRLETLLHPLVCDPRWPLGAVTRNVQYAACWRRA
jgi:SAM-dependent methyltransferase